MHRVSWQEYNMGFARHAAIKSKDPSTKVGCAIIDTDGVLVSTGYNGFVRGCNEDDMTFDRPMKYQLIIHAEMNALLFADNERVKNSTCYVTHAPCAGCLKHLMQAKVKAIYFEHTELMKRFETTELQAILRLLNSMPDFECTQLVGHIYQWTVEQILADRNESPYVPVRYP